MPAVVPVVQSKTTCASRGCNHMRVNRKCPRLMCREHCLLKREGYCAVHGSGQVLSQGTGQPSSHSLPFTTLRPVTTEPSLPSSTWQSEFSVGLAQATEPLPITHSHVQPIPSQLETPPAGDVTRRPKITTQMNAVWMAEYQTTPAATRAHAAGLARSEKDLSSVRRFFLVYWDNSEDPALVQFIQECLSWPRWQLGTYTQLGDLGFDITSVQLYSVPHRIWVDIALNHTHHLTTDCAVFIRRKGVRGIDEQDQIDRFIQPPARRFRQDFSDERSALQHLNKQKGRAVDTPSDSEVEIIEWPSSFNHLPDFNVDGPSTVKRRRIDNSTEPPLSLLSPLSSPIPSLASIADTPPCPISPSPPLASRCRWPADWFAIDIVNGFRAIDASAPLGKETREHLMSRVCRIYNCHIPYTTYNDQRQRWKKAPQSLREQVLAAGQTPLGLWSTFVREVPLKSAQ